MINLNIRRGIFSCIVLFGLIHSGQVFSNEVADWIAYEFDKCKPNLTKSKVDEFLSLPDSYREKWLVAYCGSVKLKEQERSLFKECAPSLNDELIKEFLSLRPEYRPGWLDIYCGQSEEKRSALHQCINNATQKQKDELFKLPPHYHHGWFIRFCRNKEKQKEEREVDIEPKRISIFRPINEISFGDDEIRLLQGAIVSKFREKVSNDLEIEPESAREVSKESEEEQEAQTCNESCQLEMAKASDASYAVTGLVAPFGYGYGITLKMWDVSKSAVLASANERSPGTPEDLMAAALAAAESLVDQLPKEYRAQKEIELSPVRSADKSASPLSNKSYTRKYSSYWTPMYPRKRPQGLRIAAHATFWPGFGLATMGISLGLLTDWDEWETSVAGIAAGAVLMTVGGTMGLVYHVRKKKQERKRGLLSWSLYPVLNNESAHIHCRIYF